MKAEPARCQSTGEQDWGWDPNTADGKTNACQLVSYQTPYSAFKEGDYSKCVQHYFNVTVVDDAGSDGASDKTDDITPAPQGKRRAGGAYCRPGRRSRSR